MQDASLISDDANCAGDQGDKPPKRPFVDWSAIHLAENMKDTLRAVKRSKLHEKVSVYEGFGSFHSENVEDLINMPDSEYVPPKDLPSFARRVLSREQLQQLGLMRCHDSGKRSAAAQRKRGRDGEGRSPVGDSCAKAAEPLPSHQTTPAVASPASSFDDENGSDESHDDAEGEAPPSPEGERAQGESPGSGATVATAVQGNALLTRLATEPVAVCAMGREFREQHFMITPDVTFINHGAFGSSLVGAAAIKRSYEDLMESEVVEFVDRKLLPLIVNSIRSLSRFLRADPRQIVLLQNATFGLNCAVKLIEKDDVVAFLDTEYLSVYKMMWFRCQEVGATHHEISLSRFLHDEKVMGNDAEVSAEIVRQLPQGCTTMIIDCVTSTSALCLPIFSHIIPALRKSGVQKIIVDGAHSPLQVDLNFTALPPESQPTIFVGNLHKWFSSPKSVGFFWVRSEDADNVHSVVLSHGAGDGLLSEFVWDGTRDYGAYLSIPAIVDFWETQGVSRVRAYCTALLESAAAMLTQAFRSRPVARHSPFMSLVELPEELQDEHVTAKYIQDLLHDVYAIEVPVKRVEGRFYVRVSVFVYNTPEEYVFLREAVLDIADRWFHSEERRQMVLAATRRLEALLHERTALSGSATLDVAGSVDAANAMATAAASQLAAGAVVPCDERIRRQGGCGVSGLDPSLKRAKTRKF